MFWTNLTYCRRDRVRGYTVNHPDSNVQPSVADKKSTVTFDNKAVKKSKLILFIAVIKVNYSLFFFYVFFLNYHIDKWNLQDQYRNPFQ